MDEVKVMVKFTIPDPDTGASYTDALYFTTDDYVNLEPKELERLKQERFDNWKRNIKGE